MEFTSKQTTDSVSFEAISWEKQEIEIFKNFLSTCRIWNLRHYGNEIQSLNEKHTGVCFAFASHMIEGEPQNWADLFEIFFNNIWVEEDGLLDLNGLEDFRYLLRDTPYMVECPQSSDPSRDYTFCDGSVLHLSNPHQVAFAAFV